MRDSSNRHVGNKRSFIMPARKVVMYGWFGKLRFQGIRRGLHCLEIFQISNVPSFEFQNVKPMTNHGK